MGIYMHMWLWLYKLREKRCIKHCKKKYPDYVDDEYNLRNLKFIWGVRSAGTLHDSGANFNTVNDMDIIYDRDTKLYRMSVETIYIFPDRKTDCKYLRDCLKSFTQYMDDNGLDKNKEYALCCSDIVLNYKGESVEIVYTQFRLFVEGFCRLYEKK